MAEGGAQVGVVGQTDHTSHSTCIALCSRLEACTPSTAASAPQLAHCQHSNTGGFWSSAHHRLKPRRLRLKRPEHMPVPPPPFGLTAFAALPW